MRDPFHQLLGLAFRARRVVTGDELVLRAVRRGRVRLVILAADASERTKKKWRDKCAFYAVPLVVTSDRMQLGEALGKHARVVIGVTDENFARRLRELAGNDSLGVRA